MWVTAKARRWARCSGSGPTFRGDSVVTILETCPVMSPLNLSSSARSPGTQGTRQGLGAPVPVLVTPPGKLRAGHARPVVTGPTWLPCPRLSPVPAWGGDWVSRWDRGRPGPGRGSQLPGAGPREGQGPLPGTGLPSSLMMSVLLPL